MSHLLYRKSFTVKIFSDSLAYAKIKHAKYMCNINDNAVQGQIIQCQNLSHKNLIFTIYGNFVPLQVLLHRSAGEEGRFLSVKSSEFDQDLFLLSWGPTVAALSYVFDKADEKSIVQRAVDGFRYIYKNDS